MSTYVGSGIMAAVLLVAGFAGSSAFVLGASQPQGAQAPASEAWQKEFDQVCSRTQDAMSFSEEELAGLVRKCDSLLPQIEKLDETRRKVYVGRLKMCRGLYAYVLESKKNEKK